MRKRLAAVVFLQDLTLISNRLSYENKKFKIYDIAVITARLYTHTHATQVNRKEYSKMEVITKMQPISTLTNNMARIDIVVNIVAGCGCK